MLPKDIIKRGAQLYKDKAAFVFKDQRISFSEMNSKSNKLANALLKAGIKKNDRIAVILPNCIEILVVRFASYKIGAALVPLNPNMFEKEGFIKAINHSECRAVITKIKLTKKDIPKAKLIISSDYEKFLNKGEDKEPNIKIAEDDITWIGYSSGTTGEPKGVLTSSKNWIQSMYNLFMNFPEAVNESDVLMHLSPLTHGTQLLVLPFYLKGCTQVIIEEYDFKYIIKKIKKENVTIAYGIPAILMGILRETFRPWYLVKNPFMHYLKSVRTFGYGSAPMYLNHLRLLIKRFGKRLVQSYGMSEVFLPLTMLNKKEHDINSEKLRSVGKVALGVEIMIVDKNKRNIGLDKIGRIAIKSDTITKGYLKRKDLTKEAYVGEWFFANDMGKLDKDNYLYLAGRNKEMIIKRGLNIFPEEIENAILKDKRIAECAVFGIPDVRYGEEICAAVAAKEGITEEEIKKLCRKSLNKFMIPSKVDFHETLPKNYAGKIMKKELKKQYWEETNIQNG